LKQLIELYRIHSPSNNEQQISSYIEGFLKENEIDYKKTKDFQLYNVIPYTPLICAHMDQVGLNPTTNIYFYDNNYIFGDTNIGADDKNGVFILMNLLLQFKNRVSFIFSTGEEVGCNINNILKTIDPKDISYALVFDRANGKDIIGTANNYCNDDLEKDISSIGKKYGYRATQGLFSDCDMLARFKIPCVNLSCGYYNAHSNKEFTSLEELKNAYDFGFEILNTLDSYYSRIENYHSWLDYFDDEPEYLFFCPQCESFFDVNEIIYDTRCPVCKTGILYIRARSLDYDYFDNIEEVKYICIDCDKETYEKGTKYPLNIPKDCTSCLGDVYINTKYIDEYTLDRLIFNDYIEKYFCPVCEVYLKESEVIDNMCIFCCSSIIKEEVYDAAS
jgi:tripeptide aminopeptidase